MEITCSQGSSSLEAVGPTVHQDFSHVCTAVCTARPARTGSQCAEKALSKTAYCGLNEAGRRLESFVTLPRLKTLGNDETGFLDFNLCAGEW